MGNGRGLSGAVQLLRQGLLLPAQRRHRPHVRRQLYQRTGLELDIDRQSITVFGTPAEVDALIRMEVEKLSCPDGGLMMIFGLYPGTPLKNVEALMDAMERYAVM